MPPPGAQSPHIYSTPPVPSFPLSQHKKEEIFHKFKLKITIDATFDTIKCRRNSIKTHQLLVNVHGVNILGKYKQKEREAIK
jgi:hypothetical protein